MEARLGLRKPLTSNRSEPVFAATGNRTTCAPARSDDPVASITVRSIALANQKGGVGKTTTAIHLAHGLALAGHRVAIFDMDPQGNATVALQGMESPGSEPLLGFLLPIAEGLWMLPSPGLTAFGDRRAQVDVEKLKALAAELEGLIDWLVVDCPPRMDEWGWAGIQLCDDVLVPVQAEFFAMHGLSQMMASLEAAASSFPGKANLRGVLPTMVNLREPVAREVLEDLEQNLGSTLMKAVIYRDPSLVEAASHGKSIFVHTPWAKSALCYAEVVKELIDG